jgi:hypothetical protein
MKKSTKKPEEKKLSKSEQRRVNSLEKEQETPSPIKDSNAAREGVKYRVTFLTGCFFRGRYRELGDVIELPENDAKAYMARTNLKFERIE